MYRSHAEVLTSRSLPAVCSSGRPVTVKCEADFRPAVKQLGFYRCKHAAPFSMNDDAENPPEPLDLPLEAEDDMEMSLSELGRAYAKAVGLIPDVPLETEMAGDEPAENDAAVCPISPRSILEAILFVGTTDEDQPLTTRQIASMIRDVTPKEISQLARELNEEYEEDGTAYRIQRERSMLRMVLAEEYEPVREGFYGEVRKARLSQQAVDVLAIVAYHQPTTREHVNDLRSRDCGSILNQLVKRQLLSMDADPENARSKLYRTTDRFLELFGLETLDDLPQSAEALLPDADIE
jgi:segregation and condensation protein B